MPLVQSTRHLAAGGNGYLQRTDFTALYTIRRAISYIVYEFDRGRGVIFREKWRKIGRGGGAEPNSVRFRAIKRRQIFAQTWLLDSLSLSLARGSIRAKSREIFVPYRARSNLNRSPALNQLFSISEIL